MSEDTGATPTADTSATDAPAVPATPPTTDHVDIKLREFGATDEVVAAIKDGLGVSTLDDLTMVNEGDLVGAGLKPVPARKLLASLTAATSATEATADGSAAMDAILPVVPDDGSWLNMLRTGGLLKVNPSTAIAAVRAALANRVGLYNIPAKLVAEMERFAETSEEPVSPEYFALRKQLTRRTYGDIFEAIDGLDGSYVTDKRKHELLERLDKHLWPAIFAFNAQLKSWQEAWLQQGANPAMLMAALANMGGGGPALPTGMMQPPDTGTIRDSAAGVNDAVNRVFAGTGVQISGALAYEATQIRQSLEDPRLPSMIGAANREQMLRQLGVAVSPAYARLETNLARFVLGIMQAQDQPSGNEELQYFNALYQLGSQISWDELRNSGVNSGELTGIGGRPSGFNLGSTRL